MRVIIIGAGPGGYTAAFEAAARGMEAVLVEQAALGGTCLNHGCIPTKTLRAGADALALARRMAEFGVTGCCDPAIDPVAAQKRKNSVIGVLTGGLEKTCARLGVRLIRGQAELAAPGRVRVRTQEGEEVQEADAIIIATGSRILELPGLAFDHTHILDSNDALDLESVPQRLLIVGGGVIGCELACIFRTYGSEVAIVEGQDRLLPMPLVDAEVSALLARELRKRKVKMFTGATVGSCRVEGGAVHCTLAPSPFVEPAAALKAETEVEADMVFVTVGRAPATEGLGLERAGVAVDRRGWIVVDNHLRTNVPGVYAIGDVLGPARIMLAHVAAVEGLTVIDGLCGGSGVMDYAAVPSAIFTEPEIGCVGLSERQAREQFPHVECAVTQMRELGKAQAMGELPGFFKLVANAADGRILGAHVMGAHASDLVAEATLAIRQGITAGALAATIHAHPTLAEGFFETSRALTAALAKHDGAKA